MPVTNISRICLNCGGIYYAPPNAPPALCPSCRNTITRTINAQAPKAPPSCLSGCNRQGHAPGCPVAQAMQNLNNAGSNVPVNQAPLPYPPPPPTPAVACQECCATLSPYVAHYMKGGYAFCDQACSDNYDKRRAVANASVAKTDSRMARYSYEVDEYDLLPDAE
jgi:hypothetical protein